MFQNAFQSGPFIEVFDPKINKDKDKNAANLFKANTPNLVNKIYDKEIKGYIYDIDGYSTKMRFPKDEKIELCLLQQYLVMQVYLPVGTQWNLELVITDTSKTKRRINFIPQFNKIEKKFFHVKVPNEMIRHGEWLNLQIDTHSFMEAWNGQTFRSLDSIVIGSQCKLRKIFTMKNPIFQFGDDDEQLEPQSDNQQVDIPRQVNFPPGIVYSNQLLSYQGIVNYVDQKQGLIPEKIMANDSLQQTDGNITDSVQSNVFGSRIMKQVNKSTHSKISKAEMYSPDIQGEKISSKNKSNVSQSIQNHNSSNIEIAENPSQKPKKSKAMDNLKQQLSPQQVITGSQSRNSKSVGRPQQLQIGSRDSEKLKKNRSSYDDEEDSTNNQDLNNRQALQQQAYDMSMTSGSESRNSQKAKFQKKNADNSAVKNAKERNSLSLNSKQKNIFQNQDKTPNRPRPSDVTTKDSSSNLSSGLQSSNTPTSSQVQANKKRNNQVNGSSQPTNGLRSPYTTNEQQSNPWKQNAFKKLNYLKEEDNTAEKKPQKNQFTRQELLEQQSQQLQQQQAQRSNQKDLIDKRDIKTAQLNQNKKKFKPKGIQDGKKEKPSKEKPIVYKDIGKDALIRTGGDLRSTSDNDFFELSQKFQTISDPRVFQMSQNKFITNNKLQEHQENDEEYEFEIEENIEDESRQSQVHSPKNQQNAQNNAKFDPKQKLDTKTSKKKRSVSKKTDQSSECAESVVVSNSKIKNHLSNVESPDKVDLQDSLEMGPNFNHPLVKKKNDIDNFINNRSSQAISEEDDENKEQRQSYYDRHFTKYLNVNQRPFTPPFQTITPLQGSSLITKKNKETVIIEKTNNDTESKNDEANMLEVIYDPVLNCYYDPQTNSYYELKA